MTTSIPPQPSPLSTGPKVPFNNASAFSDASLAAIVRRANTFGLNSFIIAAESGAREVSVRFEKITADQALKILIAGMHQAVQFDLDTRDRSETYRAALKSFLEEIMIAVRNLKHKTNML